MIFFLGCPERGFGVWRAGIIHDNERVGERAIGRRGRKGDREALKGGYR